MDIKNSVEKLFPLLILGGANLAQANEPEREPLLNETNKYCQMEFELKRYDFDGQVKSSKLTCFDSLSSDEILAKIEEAREETCKTPFCGCWLG